MSMKSWRESFYPVAADSYWAVKSDADALRHSMNKWIGLRDENLKDNGVVRIGSRVIAGNNFYEDDSLTIGSESCALCHKYIDNGCRECPLYLSRNGRRCDQAAPDDAISCSPWHMWIDYEDPEPMIQLIERATEEFGGECVQQ